MTGEVLVFIFLVAAGILAGIVSVVSSMASLVSYPALLLAGVSPVYANVTNTAALIFTGMGAAVSSVKELKNSWRNYIKYIILILIGAVIGSFLVVIFPGKIFEKLVPFFVLFSAFLFLVSGKKSTYQRRENNQLIAQIEMFAAGVYTGYFGAAAGILMLIALLSVSKDSFVVVNAVKNVIGSLGNLIALVIFLFTSKVYWAKAIPLALGLFIGGFLGQKIIKFLPVKAVRIITFIFAVFLAIYLGWQAYC
ncbi:sulfite exporter TauE/SafE family protein [Lactobacillus mulieris]|uniref:Probable membrane transporter protein n=1 Tax=Lactobacillus mulieris TaxID=2508708 RepID=A0AAW5WYD4_9LACO|nr:sulfite exporter TauE/SafE family protein [Lactobacillus mulieris]MCZ3622072.1 sulfite exporter TauE/SafE family protein [Lactobacillus mulieris]MCZ3623769.1 sulfite exporter TauE/SafE family protein [Lactobacillus mulieris]MCZ3636079.1 sulfite exporter TauE/SafE family protein [Lactobacillus mulieris]MCZ3689990.1 sulfite exporter TauE/SafE family protein [Lactobacillus mulieris]MCZ3696169.1 sulfite exporter TauE/SafE family protein [Lactobacillus mulieris]